MVSSLDPVLEVLGVWLRRLLLIGSDPSQRWWLLALLQRRLARGFSGTKVVDRCCWVGGLPGGRAHQESRRCRRRPWFLCSYLLFRGFRVLVVQHCRRSYMFAFVGICTVFSLIHEYK